MLRRDPSLEEWFARRKAADEHLAKALASIPIPAGLRERLLNLETGGRLASPTRWWARREAVLAFAAIFVASITGILVRVTRPPRLSPNTWQSEALAMMRKLDSGEQSLDHKTNDSAAIQGFLRDKGFPIPAELPHGLTSNSRVGCKTFQVQGKPASIICFELSPGLLAHLVVLDVGPEVSGTQVGQPSFAENGQWRTASWSDGTKTYMIGTRAGLQQLKGLLDKVG
jgi:hypothetical protein